MRIKIKLNTFLEIKKFAEKVTRVCSDVDIIKGSVHYDAKSIMGVLNMGSLDDVYVEINTNDEKEIALFTELMSDFAV